MSLINTLAWWQWLVLLAVPPAIVALYFLKLKRQPLQVPSTYLWHRSIEDLHVNSIWQRLRQNLLLFLQLLLILIAILALLRPGWQSYTLQGERLIFVIDNSASMSATDVAPTRLAEAKRKAAELIDQMASGDKAMVISFAADAQVMQAFTDNRRELRRAVEAIEPTARSTSLVSALQLAAGLANPGRMATDANDVAVADALPAELFIFSDGRFPDVQGFSLGNLTPTFVPIGSPRATNYGIIAFSTRPHQSEPDQQQVFAELENFSEADANLVAELYLDDALIDASETAIPAGETRGIVFDLADTDAGVLRLQLRSRDALPLDNVAYAVLDRPRRARGLLVTPGNDPLQLALATQKAQELAEIDVVPPSALKTDDYQQNAIAGYYDLILYDQCRPPAMPQSNTLFFGRLPPTTSGWQTAQAERVPAPQIIDSDRAHPLMQLIELGNVEIAESLVLRPPPGSEVLVDSHQGPIMAIAPRGGFEDVVVGFELVGQTEAGEKYANTNWPLRLSFPTFILNALQYLGGQSLAGGSLGARPGEVVQLKPTTLDAALAVRRPDGQTEAVAADRTGTVHFSGTTQLGVYQLREKNQATRRFAVNLLDRNESNLAPRTASVQIGFVEVEGQRGLVAGRRELWKWLLSGALVVLVLEWYIYNRRVYI